MAGQRPSNCWAVTYTFDPWGNLYQFGANSSTQSAYTGCSQESGLTTQASTKNQLVAYPYDAAGNVSSVSGTPATYTPDNLISTYGTTTGIGSYRFYTYGGDGQRIAKGSVSTYCICPLSATSTNAVIGGGGCASGCSKGTSRGFDKIYWYGAASQPLAETDSAGNTQNEYISFGGAHVARVDSSNNVAFYFADHLGTSRIVTNSSGSILDDSDFYPFGAERPITSSSGNTYKFTGYERDSESGLDYASARHFSSTMGRFMSPDPISGSPGNPQSWNRYSYVYNNPLNLTDSSGMDPCDDDPASCDWFDWGFYQDGSAWGTGILSTIPLDFSSSAADLSTNPLTGQYDASTGYMQSPGLASQYLLQQQLNMYPADGSMMSTIMNTPSLASNWATTFHVASNVVNYGTAWTALGVGAVVAAPVLVPTAANAVGYGVGYLQGAAASGTGILLGKWVSANENYIIDAEESGLGYFNLGRAWKVFDYLGDAWNANRGALDAVIERGTPIYLRNMPVGAVGTYARELKYLFEQGVQNHQLFPAWNWYR